MVKISLERIMVLIMAFIFGVVSCKSVDVPDKYPQKTRNPARAMNPESAAVRPSTSPATPPTQAQTLTQIQPEPTRLPSYDEIKDPNMKKFVIVYQTSMEGETEPCG